jgi:hypothetical protein
MHTAFHKTIAGVDWELLHGQKQFLFGFLDEAHESGRAEEEQAIEGILNLIDGLQDAADEAGLWKFPQPGGDAS